MVDNFMFRSAVRNAALWIYLQKLARTKATEKPMVIFYEYQNKFKAIIK